MQNKTFVIDLDGTLCVSSGSNYKTSRPIWKRIQQVNSLANEGHKIVIFTARGMNTFKGISFLAKARWFLLTKNQLRIWGVAHHKLILGKPAGDFYVDDKAVVAGDFFSDLELD